MRDFGLIGAVVALVALTSGCGYDGHVSWNQDIEPLLEGRCLGCHGPGDVSGIDLTRYDAAYAWRDAIKAAVVSGDMPPWPADGDCNEYEFDPRLTDEEIALIADWVDGGAPEGGVGVAPAEPPPSVERTMERVDLELAPEHAYQLQSAPDDYRCFVVDWPIDEEVYVTGLRAVPGNRSVVHHVISFVAGPDEIGQYEALDAADPGPGYACYGGPGGESYQDARWLGGWAPGYSSGNFPDGTGIRVDPGSGVIVQVHYNAQSTDVAPDRTTLQLQVEPTVDRPGRIQPWTNPGWLDGGMPIPAHTTGVEHGFSYPYWVDSEIHLVLLHMHTLGRSGRVTLTDELTGTEQCLLDIPDWDFGRQMVFKLEDPVRVRSGDTLSVQCTWDNPTGEDVDWGDGTGDEMCLSTLYMAPPAAWD